MTTVLLAAYWVLAGAVVLAVPPALYVLGCCAVDAFAYDPWLDGPRRPGPSRPAALRAWCAERLSALATDRFPLRANEGLDRQP